MIGIEEISAAAARIEDVAVKTPLVSAPFDGQHGAVWLKAESLQPIGSFKLRGAANKILQLTPGEIQRGVITYSSGNHAQGVAYAARAVGAKAVIVMPANAPAIKRQATLALGAEIVDVGVASSERLAKAEELVRQHGYVIIPPTMMSRSLPDRRPAAWRSWKLSPTSILFYRPSPAEAF